MVPLARLFLILLFTAAAFGQNADLAILSIVPSQPAVFTDQTFQFTARVRNHGPGAAAKVNVAVGANALTLLQRVKAPAGWTCDLPAPRFGYAATCTVSTLAAGAEAELTLTLSAPQHTAMTYRVTALAGTSTSDPEELNNGRQTGLPLQTSERHAELAITGEPGADARGRFAITNNGPHEAREVLVILGGGLADGPTLSASGSGWKCAGAGKSVACTRATLAPKATASIDVRATAPAAASVVFEGRVRAEQVYDSNGRNNAATVTVTATPSKSKRRAARP
jgi:hypothetical protein